jgi:peptidoglycan/LPS O-acetylase OafA/YrhL
MGTSAPAGNRRDLQFLDVLRSIGFAMVVVVHALDINGISHFGVLPQIPPVVDLFFLISGFVAGYANDDRLRLGQRSPVAAITARAARLLPLVFLGTLLGALPFFIRQALWADTRHLVSGAILFIKGCLLIPGSPAAPWLAFNTAAFPFDVPVWFLFFDMLGFLLFLFCLRFLSLSWLFAVTGLLGVGMWWFALAYNSLNPGAWTPELLPVTPRTLFDFSYGYLLFRLYRPGRWKLAPGWGIAIAGLLLAVLCAPLPVASPFSGAFQAAVVTFLFPPVLIAGVHLSTTPRLNAVARLGARMSLAVYVMHFPAIVAVNDLLLHRGFPETGSYGRALVEGLAALLAGCLAAIFFDEPVQAWLTRLRQAARSRNPVTA